MADAEDEHYEAQGCERVAHLIQVSLDLPSDKQAPGFSADGAQQPRTRTGSGAGVG